MADHLLDLSKFYAEDKKLKKEDVETLANWCKQQRHFPQVDEIETALALHACYYSVEQAKTCLENFFTIRTMLPDQFQNGNPDKNPNLKQAMHVNLMPKKTKEGYRVYLSKLMDTNPDIYNPNAAFKLFDMNAMRLVHIDGPSEGIVSVIDMKGAVFGHLTKINLGDLKKFLVYLQTAMPIRLMAVHFINVVPFMDTVMSMIKPFVSKELFQRLIVHTNINTLYKYVPQECLPEEYGGQAGSMNVIHENTNKQIYDSGWFFDYLDTKVVDESKRIGARKNAENLFGFDGTFKKLSVD